MLIYTRRKETEVIMTDILETAMLLCFGCSWPISLIKNIKAHTAAGTSLGFTLLILTGYLAGITAKLIKGVGGLVLYAYIFNLVIVVANLVVYFINKRHDKAAEANNNNKPQIKIHKECKDMNTVSQELTRFSQLNEVSPKGGVVFFGSTFMKDLPVSELAADFDMHENVYNRSVEGLKIADAENAIQSCVAELDPSKVFVCLGDADVTAENFNTKEFLSQYEWLLYSLHDKCKAELFIVSVMSNAPVAQTINNKLKTLAKNTGCSFIDCTASLGHKNEDVIAFETLRYHIRNGNMSFATAMRMAN